MEQVVQSLTPQLKVFEETLAYARLTAFSDTVACTRPHIQYYMYSCVVRYVSNTGY